MFCEHLVLKSFNFQAAAPQIAKFFRRFAPSFRKSFVETFSLQKLQFSSCCKHKLLHFFGATCRILQYAYWNHLASKAMLFQFLKSKLSKNFRRCAPNFATSFVHLLASKAM